MNCSCPGFNVSAFAATTVRALNSSSLNSAMTKG